MDLNDYELVVLAQEGNEEATKKIYEKYTPLIVKKSRDAIKIVSHHGIDINDIIQECYISLDEAIKSFKQTEDATFYTFAVLCIDRKITNFIRKATNKKSKILNDAVTLDDVFGNLIGDGSNVEKAIVSRFDDYDKINHLRDNLTELERNVLDLKINGYSFDEIAKKLNKDLKSIYNTFNRIKIKYKNINKIDN